MGFETHPVTPDRFEDFADVVNPRRRATHCWCLVHRLSAAETAELAPDAPEGRAREAAARALGHREHPPGVVGYADGVPVGWCSLGPRRDNPRLRRSKLLRPTDDRDVWSIICVVVRGGHRRRGHTRPLIEGAVAWAASCGAPAIEAHPVDTEGVRMDTTMAFVGTRAMFEGAGFAVVGRTEAVAGGRPRLAMRREL